MSVRMMRLVAATVLLGSACGAGTPVSSARFDLGEFTIDGENLVLAAGPIDVAINNVGELPHTIVISSVGGEVITGSDVLQGGESGLVVVTLPPGEYEFTCRIVAEFDGALVDHYELGMGETVTVVG